MKLGSFLWTLPFLCFMTGYYFISWFVGIETIEVPGLIGSRLADAVAVLSPHHVHVMLLGEVEEPMLPEGTVVRQRPRPGERIKMYQSLGVVISRKPSPLRAQCLVGRLCSDIVLELQRQKTRFKIYYIPDDRYPSGVCIAQYPSEGQELVDQRIELYVSSGAKSIRLMPDFKGKSIQEVIEFLALYGVKPMLIPSGLAAHTSCSSCKVLAQKPLVGSIVNMEQLPCVQLQLVHREE